MCASGRTFHYLLYLIKITVPNNKTYFTTFTNEHTNIITLTHAFLSLKLTSADHVYTNQHRPPLQLNSINSYLLTNLLILPTCLHRTEQGYQYESLVLGYTFCGGFNFRGGTNDVLPPVALKVIPSPKQADVIGGFAWTVIRGRITTHAHLPACKSSTSPG
jgi:hypothetical protein